MSINFLINQHLDQKQSAALLAENREDDPILYTIIGEISKDNRYATTALAVTAALALMLLSAVVHALKNLTDDAFDLRSRIVHVVSFLSAYLIR